MCRFALFIVSISMLSPLVCRADGYANTTGTARDGWTVVFGEPNSIEAWRHDEPAHARTFADEPCAFTDDLARIPHPHKSGKSPLAGTIYEIRPAMHSVCERGDPASRLTCVSGCSDHAPNVLLTGYWEC